MSDDYRDQQRKRRLAEREQITVTAIAFWQERTRRFAKHSMERGDLGVREQLRQDAIDAFESMLDAIHCERTALLLLDATENDTPSRFKGIRGPKDPKTPKDPA